MRVVSQQKNYSAEFENTYFWTQNASIYAQMSGSNINFAGYRTAKRAGEVFQALHDAYCNGEKIFYMPGVNK